MRLLSSRYHFPRGPWGVTRFVLFDRPCKHKGSFSLFPPPTCAGVAYRNSANAALGLDSAGPSPRYVERSRHGATLLGARSLLLPSIPASDVASNRPYKRVMCGVRFDSPWLARNFTPSLPPWVTLSIIAHMAQHYYPWSSTASHGIHGWTDFSSPSSCRSLRFFNDNRWLPFVLIVVLRFATSWGGSPWTSSTRVTRLENWRYTWEAVTGGH